MGLGDTQETRVKGSRFSSLQKQGAQVERLLPRGSHSLGCKQVPFLYWMPGFVPKVTGHRWAEETKG